jgi:hypothetical protein
VPGYQAHGVGAKEQQNQAHPEHSMKRTEAQFVVCIKNIKNIKNIENLRIRGFTRGAEALLADDTAAQLGQIRVIDESGEDDLYPEQYFVPVPLPRSGEKAVGRATGARA